MQQKNRLSLSVSFWTCILLAAAAIGAWWTSPSVHAAPAATAPATAPASGPAAATHVPAREEAKGPPPSKDDKLSITHHQIRVNGAVLQYEATAGTLLMKDDAGKPQANYFFVAYRLESEDAGQQATTQPIDADKRPITFVFNGGPGAASVWLHLGALGPQRVNLTDDGRAIGPPYKLVDNPQTWLDQTDLVFIDPVGTGYSRPAEGVKAEEFYGVEADVRSVADFIRLYTTRYHRWLSPKFLAGESYGTTRAAALSQYLLDRYGLELNGIVFMSTVLDFQTLMGTANDLPFALNIPSYTATAWYQKKLAPELQQNLEATLKEAEQWAMNDYLTALGKGASLDAQQRADVVSHLARFTGLNEDFIDKSNLRISANAFRKQLLNDQKKVVGRFDSRETGDDIHPAEDTPEFDPSFPQYFAEYTAAFNHYASQSLGYESDLDYEVLSGRVRPWSFVSDTGYLDVARALADAMHANPHMKVMFASGYFDLATPYLGTNYTLDHMNLSPELRSNITRTYYMAGHMLYHPKASLEKLKSDVSKFFQEAEKP